MSKVVEYKTNNGDTLEEIPRELILNNVTEIHDGIYENNSYFTLDWIRDCVGLRLFGLFNTERELKTVFGIYPTKISRDTMSSFQWVVLSDGTYESVDGVLSKLPCELSWKMNGDWTHVRYFHIQECDGLTPENFAIEIYGYMLCLEALTKQSWKEFCSR